MLLQVKFGNSQPYTYHCADYIDVREGDTVEVPARYAGTRTATVVSVGGSSSYVRDIVRVLPRPKFRTRIVSSRSGETIDREWRTLEEAQAYLKVWLNQGGYSEASIICE